MIVTRQVSSAGKDSASAALVTSTGGGLCVAFAGRNEQKSAFASSDVEKVTFFPTLFFL